MSEFDFRDHYIGYEDHPRFQINRIITDDAIRVIIQKYEMLLFTNKGELLGNPDFGCDLPILLHQTKISAKAARSLIVEQIDKYIPELNNTDYKLEVSFLEDPERYQNVMLVQLTIRDYEIQAVIR